MKKWLMLMMCILILILPSCSLMQGRSESNNTHRVRGSYVWYTDRKNGQFYAKHLNRQFGDQGGNDNNSYLNQDCIHTDRQDFSYIKKQGILGDW